MVVFSRTVEIHDEGEWMVLTAITIIALTILTVGGNNPHNHRHKGELEPLIDAVETTKHARQA